jgi:hypothetical protein
MRTLKRELCTELLLDSWTISLSSKANQNSKEKQDFTRMQRLSSAARSHQEEGMVSSGTGYLIDSGNEDDDVIAPKIKILVESYPTISSSQKSIHLPSQHFNKATSRTDVLMPSLPTPTEPKNMDEVNALLANEFTCLSVEEREKALNDIHGVTDATEEDPAVLSNALIQLDIELDKIANKRAYNMAKAQRPEYVRNRRFLLKFLRAENINAKNAAARIVRSFESKLELFGEDKLAKDITMNDLDPYERELLRSGNVQILPRDITGRTVLWSMGQIYRGDSTATWVSKHLPFYIAH